MKIRNGFISNSSSSSFIVSFPYRPKSHYEIKRLLFHDKEEIEIKPYKDERINRVNTTELSKHLYEQVKEQKPNNREEIFRGLINHVVIDKKFKDWNEMSEFMKEGWNSFSHKIDVKEAKKIYEELKENGFIYVFTFWHNEGGKDEIATLGDIFHNYPHQWIWNN